ncbi:MAG: hypothetical protein KGM47_01120 [Acidobacteriota bacterium]|nr:hypothetical protein [Acidobacteriota bacterium]
MLSRLLKNPQGDVILSAAKDLLVLLSKRSSRCFAALSMTGALFQRPGRFVVILLAAFLGIAPSASARVFLRWTEPSLPRAQSLGVRDLVVEWEPRARLIVEAKRQGYRVYAEVIPGQASGAAEAAAKEGLAGIFIKSAAVGNVSSGAAGLVEKLQRTHPSLVVRLLDPGGKQPQMRGSIVVDKRGVLAVSSPTEQPWIDSNVAFIRFERAIHPHVNPLVSFAWNLTDPIEQRYGPPVADYELAIAEAGSFHADVILPLDKNLQDGLAAGNARAFEEWKQISRYISFYAHDPAGSAAQPVGNVGVVTDAYQNSYEAVNLMARHNISFRYIRAGDLSPSSIKGLALVAVFGQRQGAAENSVLHFAEAGGVAVLVGPAVSLSSSSFRLLRKNAQSALYAAGKGKIAEIEPPITDPEAFARDVWRLLSPAERELTLWNALTTLASAYQDRLDVYLNLVNYSGSPLRVQVRMKGIFSEIQAETPERGCCETVRPVTSGNFTEFVVPAFSVGARVRLRSGLADASHPRPEYPVAAKK